MTGRHAARAREVVHPHVVPTLDAQDMPGADDASDLGPEIRYRMISEAAYHRYLDRGCVDGFDIDDWLASESDVDHQLRGGGRLAEG